MLQLNRTVLMSGADYFSDEYPLNPYMDSTVPIDIGRAIAEHQAIRSCVEQAGLKVVKIPPPKACQDGVYTANWAICRGNKAIMAALPKQRQTEIAYAGHVLKDLGKEIIHLPAGLRFSGQGDALAVGNYLFMGSVYRTDQEVHAFVAKTLDYDVISLQTVPALDNSGQPITNALTGWPDSFFYDLDLALAVLREDLIAWCPEAFLPDSQAKLEALPIEKIAVSLEEAMLGFACNLVSTGETVVMSAHAPHFQAELEARSFKVITPQVEELRKGGGFIRCTTLTIDIE